mgnify:CR=1 FL=1
MKGFKLGRYVIPILLFLSHFILQYATAFFGGVNQLYADIVRGIGLVVWINLAILFLKQENHLQIFRLQKVRCRYLLATLLGFFFLYASVTLIAPFLVQFKAVVNQGFHELMRAALYSSHLWGFILLFEMTILVPIFEEIVCRGVIQQTYFKDSPFYFDVLISSIIFATGHFIGGVFYPLLFVLYCIRGIIYGFLCRYTNSIYYGIILHIVWNIFASWEYWNRWIDNIVFILKLHFS